MIKKDILIEELVEQYPFSVSWLSKKGIRCIVCGEPVWGTLEEACREKGFDDKGIEELLTELNSMEKGGSSDITNIKG